MDNLNTKTNREAHTVPHIRSRLRSTLRICLLLVVIAGCGPTGASPETIGVTANTEPVEQCPAISFDDSAPRLDATIKLTADTVKAGSNFEGTAVFTNDGSEPAGFLHSGTIYTLLYKPGTDTIVAIPAQTYAQMPALGLAVPVHGEADVLPAGTYEVRFPLATHLSEPAAITVTN